MLFIYLNIANKKCARLPYYTLLPNVDVAYANPFTIEYFIKLLP